MVSSLYERNRGGEASAKDRRWTLVTMHSWAIISPSIVLPTNTKSSPVSGVPSERGSGSMGLSVLTRSGKYEIIA